MARLETAAQMLETDGRQKATRHFAFEGLSQKPLQEGGKDQAKGDFSPDHLYHPSSQQRERKEHVSDEDSSQVGQGKKDILLAPKLCPPRLPFSLVVRERLLARLDASQDHLLTLITAPAGFGKTTLVSHWVNERGSQRGFPPVAWISLDAGDNDPLRFWRYVLTACQAFQADLGRSSLALLAMDEPALFPQPPFKRALTLFLNEVIHQQCHGILILEDYHVIAATEIHETMTFLLEHVPSTLRVVMMTRVEPPLPLTGLRARDELLEVHAVDLRFSLQETQRFLQQALPIQVEAAMVRHLEAYLEGWITGLRLLTLALQERQTPQEIERFLATFTGGHGYVLDYFVSEVLDAQPEPLQTFLLQTSLFNRLTASLCNAVTGRNDSQAVLEAVEHAGLFLQSIQGNEQWYRYHALFAQAMRAEVSRRLGQDTCSSCLIRAGAWYEQHGFLPEAIEALLQAHEYTEAAALIERHVGIRHATESHELSTLQRWLQQIPEAMLLASPALSFIAAYVLTFISTSDHLTLTTQSRVEMFLQGAEQAWQREGLTSRLGEVAAFRALLAVRQGQVGEAARLARQALAWLPNELSAWRTICLGAIGEAERQAGRIDEARKYFLEALSLCEAVNNRPGRRVVSLFLGEMYSESGELHLAAAFYQQVQEQAATDEDISDRAKALAGLADLSYEWNALERAEREAREAFDLGTQLADESLQVQAILLLARILHASGEASQAHDLLTTLLARMHPARSPHLYRAIQTCQGQLHLSADPLAPVEHWLPPYDGWEELPFQQREQETLLKARWLLPQGKAQEALALLESWQEAARASGRTRRLLEIQILMSLAYHRLKREQEARSLLRQVLIQASAEGYLRLFLDGGESLLVLLRPLVSRIREKRLLTYLQHVLQLFATQRARQARSVVSHVFLPTEELSPQERQVLRLLADGYSRQHIAEALFITVNTVKTHLQRIYQKLHVTGRFEACERARQLDLL